MPKAKRLEDLSDEELTAMVAKRQQAELSKLSDEELDALVMKKQEQELASMSDEELDKLVQAKLGAQGPSTTDTDITAQTLRSALEGQTAGISEPIISGAKAAGAAIPAMLAPSEQLAPEVGPAISRPQYAAELAGKAYEEDVAKRRQFKSDFPLSDIGAQIAGGIVPSPINVGAKIFKGAKMAAGVIPGAGALPSYARLALTGGLGGAGFEATRLGAERPTGFMTEEEAPSIPSALATGAVFGAAPTAIVRGAKALPKKALAAMGGVKEQVIDKYLKAAPRLAGAKSQEEVTQLAAQAVEGVKGRAIEGQKLFAEQVNQAIGELSARVSEGSSKSYQILDRSEASVGRDGIVKELNKSLNSFLVGGKPVTQAATADYQMLKFIRDNVKEMPEMLDAPSVKRLIQQIDAQTDYPTVPGARFKTPGQRELARVRASIDDVLKTQIPEYREQMAVVSADTRLLNKMVDQYGGEKAAGAVNKLLSAKQASRREEFQRFAAEMGLNLADYLAMQEDAQVFNSYNAMNAGDKVKTLIRGNSESTKEAFKRLSQLSDQDFLQFADDLNVLQSFDKDFTRGSRNVNLWSLIGGAGTAMATGNILFGGSAGAFWGSLVDKYGPAMTRKILDQVSKIQGLPTVQKIQRMELPDSVKQELSRDLIQSVLTLRDHKRPIPVSTDMAALMQDEIKSSDLSTLDKARMLNALNKDGELIDAEKLFGLPDKKSAEDLAKQRLKQTEDLDLSPAEFMEGR